MKATVIHRYGAPQVLVNQEIERPQIKADEVLVRVKAAAINPKDCLVRKGNFKIFTGNRFPMPLGEDIAGEVAEVGKNVKNFVVGQPVYGMINGWRTGAYAEFAKIKANELAPKPAKLSYQEAAAIPLAALTALQAIRDLGELQAGQKILINGCSGGVGVFALQIAKALEAEVTGVCSHRNVALSQSLGADRVIDYTQTDLLETEEKYDVFFDSFGNYHFSKVQKLLTPRGIYVTTLPKPRNIQQVFLNPFRSQKNKLVVVKSKSQDLNYLNQLIEQGKLRSVVDRTYPLSQVQEAHTYVETKRAQGKVVLEID